MGRRALITGISGQDGSYLAELLVRKGYEVAGVGHRSSDQSLPQLESIRDAVAMHQADLLDFASLHKVIATVRPDEIYHLAAPTFVPASWEDPAETITAIAGATAAVLSAARTLDAPTRIWVASSSEIFGDTGESPQHERSPMRPRSPYGVAKLAAHGLVGTFRERFGLFACSGITFNHESPRRPERFVTRKITRGAAAIALGSQDELVLGDLGAIRDWCHARDVVEGAWLALQVDAPADYVLASGRGRTVGELVDTAFAAAGVDPSGRVRVDPSFVRPPEPVALIGDARRARELLGWRPRVPFAEMIGEMVRSDLDALRK